MTQRLTRFLPGEMVYTRVEWLGPNQPDAEILSDDGGVVHVMLNRGGLSQCKVDFDWTFLSRESATNRRRRGQTNRNNRLRVEIARTPFASPVIARAGIGSA